MAEHPDVQRFRQALDARRRGTLDGSDAALLEGLFADDVVWHGAAGSADGARGKQQVIALWNAWARDGDGPTIGVDAVYADGLHTVAALELATRGGGREKVRQAVIFEMNEDGKVTQSWGLPADAAVGEAFATGTAIPEHRYHARFRTAEAARDRWTFEPEDVAAIEAFLREDVVWQGAGNSQWKEGVKGRDQVFSWYRLFKQVTNETIAMAVHETFAGDAYAVSFVTISADRPDRPDKHLYMPEVNLFHLDGEGRCFEYWGIAEDQAVMDEFWAP